MSPGPAKLQVELTLAEARGLRLLAGPDPLREPEHAMALKLANYFAGRPPSVRAAAVRGYSKLLEAIATREMLLAERRRRRTRRHGT